MLMELKVPKIWIADDDEAIRMVLEEGLKSAGLEIATFADGELLIADSDIVSGPQNNAFIPTGESFASCIANNATSTAASFSISNGVYFIRGNFIQVLDETIVLSQFLMPQTISISVFITQKHWNLGNKNFLFLGTML